MTPAEARARLHQMDEEDREAAAQQRGAPFVPTPAAAPTLPFSFRRTIVGGLADIGEDIKGFADSTARSIRSVVGLKPYDPHYQYQLHVDNPEHAGPTEHFLRGLVKMGGEFIATGGALTELRIGTALGRVGLNVAPRIAKVAHTLAAAGAVDVLQKPSQINPVNIVTDNPAVSNWFSTHFGVDPATLHDLASDPDDDSLASRFKAAAINVPLNLGLDVALTGGAKALQAYRAYRGSLFEAQAAIDALHAKMPVTEGATATAAERFNTAVSSTHTEASAAAKGPAQGDLFRDAPANDQASLGDVAQWLEHKATTGATDEQVAFLDGALHGAPNAAFRRATGIDPLKVDWSAMDNPEAFNAVKASLENAYTAIANRLGRTGERITEAMTAKAARAMATTADTLKDLYGRTENLASVMRASQTIVGAHAVNLVGKAEAALQAAKAGVDNGEWADFLQAFHRQAYFLGALRGSASEVGRALQSLQHVTSGKQLARAAKDIKGELAAETKSKAKGGLTALETADEATAAVNKMTSPAERITFLSDLQQKAGDLGDINRYVRVKSQSLLKRLTLGLINESRGNLFTALTGARNILSTAGMVGLHGAAMTMSLALKSVRAPFSREAAREFQIQRLATWAYVDGGLGAWVPGLKHTFDLLQQKGLEELALNAETQGAERLATKAASRASELAKGERGNFQRVDLAPRDRQFVMDSADLRRLHEQIDSTSLPDLMKHTLRWVANGAAEVVNIVGSAQRLPTHVFINGADQFAGTIAARAGAKAAAARVAASEALEDGLVGKDLSQYVRARIHRLTETTENSFVDQLGDFDTYSAGLRDAVLAAGHDFAAAALFQDRLESATGRGLSRWASSEGVAPAVASFFVPFVKTPLRILERTALDFTPLGLPRALQATKEGLQRDLLVGGGRRDEALSKIALGTFMMYLGYKLAEDRTIVGYDNGYGSSARLSRQQYTLKVGDALVQFNGLDPVGTVLGLGADFRQYLDHAGEVSPDDPKAQQMLSAALFAITHNVLEKTWLTGLKNIVELAMNADDSNRWSRLLRDQVARFVPAGGVQKLDTQNPLHDATGFVDGLMRSTIGLQDTLPLKRDFLGDTVVGNGLVKGTTRDPVRAELENLSFDLGQPSRRLMGVQMTAQQYSRWLDLRGHTATKDGLTMHERLRQVFALPEYQALPHAGRVGAVKETLRGYNRTATELLLAEDDDLARAVARKKIVDQGVLRGWSPEQVDQQTVEYFHSLGLDVK